VLSLKHQPHASAKLLELLVRAQMRHPLSLATIIVPVPLHPERELARGFNQAALLGRELSQAASLPFDDVSLIRAHHTSRHRAGLDAKGRRETVENAFVVRYPALIAGERVLLVDDVFTTGATVSACARVLLEAGATEVFVLTIARPQRYEL
jgi:ComF family protein